MSRIESLRYSLSNTDRESLFGLALCALGKCAEHQNGERGVVQDEEAPPAEWNMTQAMLECLWRTSPLRSTGGHRRKYGPLWNQPTCNRAQTLV